MLAAALTLIGVSDSTAQEPGGEIVVFVIDSAPESVLVTDIDLQLLAFENEMLAWTRSDFDTDQPGQAIFGGLATEPVWVYVASGSYQGGSFTSGPVAFADSVQSRLELEIFATTAQDPGLAISDYSLVFALAASGSALRVVHTLTLDLPGRAALLVNAADSYLRFDLPQSTSNFRALSGPAAWELIDDGRAIGGIATLAPGQSTFSFEYQFPFVAAGQEFAITPPIPVERLSAWAVEGQLALEAPWLARGQGLQMSERAALGQWMSDSLPAGRLLMLTVSDPHFGAFDRFVIALDGRPLAAGLTIVAILLAATAALHRCVRRRRHLAEARQLLSQLARPSPDQVDRDRLARLLADDAGLSRLLARGQSDARPKQN